jgi:uncharacterized pyridoxal phosphate-containing UPF0001 family protein
VSEPDATIKSQAVAIIQEIAQQTSKTKRENRMITVFPASKPRPQKTIIHLILSHAACCAVV